MKECSVLYSKLKQSCLRTEVRILQSTDRQGEFFFQYSFCNMTTRKWKSLKTLMLSKIWSLSLLILLSFINLLLSLLLSLSLPLLSVSLHHLLIIVGEHRVVLICQRDEHVAGGESAGYGVLNNTSNMNKNTPLKEIEKKYGVWPLLFTLVVMRQINRKTSCFTIQILSRLKICRNEQANGYICNDEP